MFLTYSFATYFNSLILLLPSWQLHTQTQIIETQKKYEIFSKLIIKTPKRRDWRHSGVFIVNFEHISHLIRVSIVNSEYVNAGWVVSPSRPNPRRRDVRSNISFNNVITVRRMVEPAKEKQSSILLIFIFTLLCGASRGFMKAFKVFL